jgi:histidine ammonia-lyase
MAKGAIPIDGETLEPRALADVARGAAFTVPPSAWERVRRGESALLSLVDGGTPVYGVTTGVGALDAVRLSPEERRAFQLSLVRSHAAAVGEPMTDEETAAMMAARLNVLVQGHSACRVETVRLLADCLAARILPVVPRLGSTGASGDLAPLAHMALVLVGEGRARVDGEAMPAADALRRAGLHPVTLDGRDGLALINGCDQATGVGSLYAEEAARLLDTADRVGAASAEALFAFSSAFLPALHALKRHPGQQVSARRLHRFLAGSASLDGRPGLRDALSVRSMPQVHGAARDALAFAEAVLEREINSANDNPLVWWDPPAVVSNGSHFHGQHVALVLDTLSDALTSVAIMSERRLALLMDEAHTGATAFLAVPPGRSSGYMIPQYTAATLVAHLRANAVAGSVQSVPTSKNTEDHNSMTGVALERLRRVLACSWQILAIEAMAATDVLERRGVPTGEGAAGLRRQVRAVVAPLTEDRSLSADMERLARHLRTSPPDDPLPDA